MNSFLSVVTHAATSLDRASSDYLDIDIYAVLDNIIECERPKGDICNNITRK
mgnify:FL=1|jgi:hypothetical protein